MFWAILAIDILYNVCVCVHAQIYPTSRLAYKILCQYSFIQQKVLCKVCMRQMLKCIWTAEQT